MKRIAFLGFLAMGLPATAMATETITYTYDAHGRLVRVVHTGPSNATVQLVYDLADNRTNLTVTGAP